MNFGTDLDYACLDVWILGPKLIIDLSSALVGKFIQIISFSNKTRLNSSVLLSLLFVGN